MTQSDLLQDFKRMMERLSPDVSDPGLELLMRQMEPAESRLLRLCGIPHHFDAERAYILDPEADRDWADRKCSEFSELSFVVPGESGWTIHDTARKYLFNSWFQSDQLPAFAAANGRLVRYFDKQIEQSSGYDQAVAQRARMFHLIGAEQEAGIQDFVHLFQKARHQLNLSECESLVKLVHEYELILQPSSAQILRYNEGKLASDERHWQQAEEIFREFSSDDSVPTTLRIKSLNRLGIVHEACRRWQEAISAYDSALDAIDDKEEYQDLKARVYHNLAISKRETNELEKAEVLLQESIRLHERLGSYGSAATAYNSLGNLYRQLNDSKDAALAYQNALTCLEKGNDHFRMAQLYNNLGLMYADMADWPESEKYFLHSLDIKKKAGDTLGQARTLNNLVRVYQNLGETEKAMQSASSAIALFKTVRDRFSLAKAKVNLARLYHVNGDDEKAKTLLEEAAQIYDQSNESNLAIVTRVELKSLDETIGMPWWAWASLIVLGLFIVLIIFVFAREM